MHRQGEGVGERCDLFLSRKARDSEGSLEEENRKVAPGTRADHIDLQFSSTTSPACTLPLRGPLISAKGRLGGCRALVLSSRVRHQPPPPQTPEPRWKVAFIGASFQAGCLGVRGWGGCFGPGAPRLSTQTGRFFLCRAVPL